MGKKQTVLEKLGLQNQPSIDGGKKENNMEKIEKKDIFTKERITENHASAIEKLLYDMQRGENEDQINHDKYIVMDWENFAAETHGFAFADALEAERRKILNQPQRWRCTRMEW